MKFSKEYTILNKALLSLFSISVHLQIFSCAVRHYFGFILIVIYYDKTVFTKVVGSRDNVADLATKKRSDDRKVQFIQIIEMTSK